MGKRLAKRPTSRFALFLALYASVFLLAVGCGLAWFWGFLDAYEHTRPQAVIDTYLAELTPARICADAGDLADQVDGRVQSSEECRRILEEAAEGELTVAKDLSQSTEERQVYVLRRGRQQLGSFWLEPSGQRRYGFLPWAVAGDSFDLSFLLSDPVSLTVPAGAAVEINGKALPEDCIAERDIPYPQLQAFAEDYALPTLVRYEAGPFLGQVQVTVLDETGTPLSPDAGPQHLPDNCSAQEKEAVETAVRGFTAAYVDFTSCNGDNTWGNLAVLDRWMVPYSPLYGRMHSALDGLYWVSDRHAVITSLDIDTPLRLADGLYLCGVTYVVDTTDLTGPVQLSSQIQLILRQTGETLLAEAMHTC